MRSSFFRLLVSLLVISIPVSVLAHDVTVSGTTTFAALDGSSGDHDGVVNGVFTVSDGDLTIAGVVNCNDSGSESACAMSFNVSGDLVVAAGGALYAENRSGGGTGGAITLSAGRDLILHGASGGLGAAIVSSASTSSSGSTGGAITATVARHVVLEAGSTIDSGSGNARAGNVLVTAGGTISADGNVLAGPSRTILSTRLTDVALAGGNNNQIGGEIRLTTTAFAVPALLVGSNANIISQGDASGAGPVTLEACGIEVRGLVAALSRKDSAATVAIRSGKGVLIDARDLGVAGATLGRLARLRADAPTGTAINKGVDIFAAEGISVLGPASAFSNSYPITSLAGVHDAKSFGGTIRIFSLGGGIAASGNIIDDGRASSGDSGGAIDLRAKTDVDLDSVVIRSFGDSSTSNPARGGGSIAVRSFSGNVSWTNGLGDVRPTGSASGLPTSDQGVITLTACGTVTTTGTSFPVNGSPTGIFPAITTGSCTPAAPALPSGSLVACNTPPVANDATATTNEDVSVTITLSGSDAEGDPLTFSIVSGPSNGSLSGYTQVNATTATIVYTGNPNFNGTDSFVYQASDGNGGTDNATVTIVVAAVNDAPSFLAGPTAISLEDAGPQTYANWATSISAGPADESGQTVTFSVTNDNPSLFSVQPALASNGTLTYTAAPNAFGSATLTIVAQDNGGTANGGSDTSAPQSGTVTVTPVNDAPSFTSGGNVTVGEDSGAYSAAWASSISAGPNESGQTLTFTASNNNNALFSAQPSISASGVLTFTPAANANGSATVSVTLSDNGGTANGGSDTSATQTFTITVTAVNDPPSFTGGGDVTVFEDSGAYSAAWASAISAGPADETGQALTFSVSNNNNALFSVQPSVSPAGVLTFTLQADMYGNATVTVTLSDDGGGTDTSAPQTFAIIVAPINDAPSFTSGGNVTVNEDSGPYSAGWATAISAGPNESGQTLTFVASNDNHALFSTQPQISASGVLTFTSVLNAFGSATVTVFLQDNGGTANGGVDSSPSVTFVITVNSVNDPPSAGNDSYQTIGNTVLQVAGAQSVASPAVFVVGSVLSNDSDVDSGPLTASLISVTPGAAVTMNPDGTFVYLPPVTYAGSDTFTYQVSDGSATATATVTITLVGRVWYVNNQGTGDGRSTSPFGILANAQASSVVNDTIFVYAGDGTTLGQNAGFALKSGQRLIGQGVALTVPVSVNGGPNPTVLLAAGSKAKITNTAGHGVTGSGVSNIEIAGIEINGAFNDGIALTGVSSAKVSSVSVLASLDDGISGVGVSGFILANSVIDGSGDSAAFDDAGINFSNLTGSASISNTTVANSVKDNVRIVNSGGVLDRVTFSNVTFGAMHAFTGNDGLFIDGSGSAVIKATITNSTFTSARSDLFQWNLSGTASGDLVMTSNAFSNNHPAILSGGGGVVIAGGGLSSPTLTFDIRQNTFRDALGAALLVRKNSGAGVFSGTIDGNTIGVSGLLGSGSRQASGIDMTVIGGGGIAAAITNNAVYQYENYGIFLQAGNASLGGQGFLNATVTGNTIAQPSSTSFFQNGFHLNAGVSSVAPSDAHNVCLTLSGNTMAGSGANGGTDFRLRQRFLTTVKLPGYAGANNDNAAVVAFVQANNPGAETGNAANTVSTGGGGYVGGAPCATP